jgi:hypothetical protein
MTQPYLGAERRLHGMMHRLLAHMAQRVPPEIPTDRGVVSRQDALDAVMRVAAVLDEQTQAGGIPPDRGVHAAAMLMLIRDHLQPLPRGLITPGGPDMVTPDLQQLTQELRTTRAASGMHG